MKSCLPLGSPISSPPTHYSPEVPLRAPQTLAGLLTSWSPLLAPAPPPHSILGIQVTPGTTSYHPQVAILKGGLYRDRSSKLHTSTDFRVSSGVSSRHLTSRPQTITNHLVIQSRNQGISLNSSLPISSLSEIRSPRSIRSTSCISLRSVYTWLPILTLFKATAIAQLLQRPPQTGLPACTLAPYSPSCTWQPRLS